MIEITYNWPGKDNKNEKLEVGRSFGHIAYRVKNIYQICQKLMKPSPSLAKACTTAFSNLSQILDVPNEQLYGLFYRKLSRYFYNIKYEIDEINNEFSEVKINKKKKNNEVSRSSKRTKK